MAELKYSSWGGAIQRTLLTDWEQPYAFAQTVEIAYPDNFEATNRALGETQSGHMKLIARGVPAFVYEQSLREDWGEDDWAKWLNDSDNRAFRVWQGQV
jgi:hypothetical protein